MNNVNLLKKVASITISIICYIGVTVEGPIPTDFPSNIMDAGLSNGVRLIAGSPVTWRGAIQKITCRASRQNMSNVTVEPLCSQRGCQASENKYHAFVAHPVPIEEMVSELSFTADYAWNNSVVYCRVYREGQVMHQYPVPIVVREQPKLLISPLPAEVYRNHRLILRCQSDSRFLAPAALQWMVIGICEIQETLRNLKLEVNVIGNESTVTLRPDDLDLNIRSVWCYANLGAEPHFVVQRTSAIVRYHELPILKLDTTDLSVYDNQSTTIKCLLIRQSYGNEQAVTQNPLNLSSTLPELRWSVGRVDSSDVEIEKPFGELNFTISSHHRSDNMSFSFVSSKSWHNRTISCWLGNNEDAIASGLHKTATVRVYKLPVIRIDPINPAFEDGSIAQLICSANGTTIGGLQFSVLCATCDSTFTTTDIDELITETPGAQESATAFFSFKVNESWRGARVECGVMGAGGSPKSFVVIDVIDTQDRVVFQTVGVVFLATVLTVVDGILVYKLFWQM